MGLETGQRLPDVELIRIGDPSETVALGAWLAGRKVVLFGVPGAYTPTCDGAHLPSFIRTADAFRARGVDEIACVSVNDVFIMQRWQSESGAAAAGITFLADPECRLGKALDIAFSAPPVGFVDRLQRFAVLAEDGLITAVRFEQERGVCDLTSGETLLDLV